MAEDPRKRRQREAKQAVKTGMSDGYYWDNGGWYNRNGVLVGHAATEDSVQTPVKSTGDSAPGRVPSATARSSYKRDTTDTPTTPTTDEKGGRFTGDDLAKIVKPGADLTKLGGEKLNDVQAQQILAMRLGGAGAGATDLAAGVGATSFDEQAVQLGGADVNDIVEVIVDALPENLRTANVLQGLDIRPYLKALNGKKIQHRTSTPWYMPDVNVDSGPLDTSSLLDVAETRATEDAVVASATAGTPVSTKYDPTKAGITPTATAAPVVDPTTGQVSTPGVTIGPNGEISFGPSAAATSPFTINDLRQMVQGDHWTLEQLAQNEDQSPTGQFPIDITGATSRQGSIHHPALSTNDALSYMRTQLSPQEIHSMQLKLANAGYFDKLDNGGAFTDGVVDDNTQAAWKLLLTDSVIQNRPTPVILGQGLKNYREQTRTARMKQLQSIDPSYSASVANDYAQSVIGKDLTPDELASLTQHLHSLVGQRAGYVAGASDNNMQAGALANTPTGTTDKDIQGALDANPTFKGEQRHQNDLALEYKLRQLMH